MSVLIDPFLHLANVKSVFGARGGSVGMASILCPAVTLSIDLPPFVEELRYTENRSHASEGIPYLGNAASAKIADHQGRAMYKWETAVVQVVSIASDKDPAKAQGLRDMVLIWMTSPTIVLHGVPLSSEPKRTLSPFLNGI